MSISISKALSIASISGALSVMSPIQADAKPQAHITREHTKALSCYVLDGKKVCSVVDVASQIEEVRYFLEVEKCYVLKHPTKNFSNHLKAIDNMSRANERDPLIKANERRFERTKTELDKQRIKSGVSFSDIILWASDVYIPNPNICRGKVL